MSKGIAFSIVLTLAASTVVLAEPIKAHPAHPHYFMYKREPIILITSAEHYGAVINKDFDYVAYFDALQAHGLNYTRIYPGVMFEPMGKFMPGNTLGPKPESLIVPWARSDTPGYRLGGNPFDLDRWDPVYFARLKDFLTQAARRGIVVEICFFNSQYEDTWPLSPHYFENNVQGVGKCDWKDAQTLKHSDLVRRQDDYVRKLTQEVNSFDNVILEICDEPGHIGTGFALAGPWVSHLADVVRDTERDLPQKHLLGQEVDGPLGGPVDFAADPRFSVIIGQYIHHSSEKVGGAYTVVPGEYREDLVINLPAGHYRAEWIDPATGLTLGSIDLAHDGGHRTLTTPTYKVDIALRVKRVPRQ